MNKKSIVTLIYRVPRPNPDKKWWQFWKEDFIWEPVAKFKADIINKHLEDTIRIHNENS